MTQVGGIELLALCSIAGGGIGYFIRNKATTTPVLGIVLGVLGAIITSILLIQFVFQSIFALSVYSALGAWLFNFVWSKIKG